MRPPGLEAAGEQRRPVAQPLAHGDVGHGRAAGDGRVDPRDAVRERAGHDRQVRALEIVGAEALGKRAVGRVRLREHQEPAGLEVDPVDHEDRPAARASFQQRRQVVPVALRRGRRQQPGRLVDDDDVRVLEHDRERGQPRLVFFARLAPRTARGAGQRAADDRHHLFACVHGAAGNLDAPAVDEHAADVQQDARLAAGQSRHARRQHLVQAAAGLLVGDGESFASGTGGHGRTLQH